ncbi:MAG: ferredoxin [bacterium]
MEAIVDQDTCIGCELCVDTCPEVFEMENEKAVVRICPVPAAAEGTCQQAVDECPVTAISIE